MSWAVHESHVHTFPISVTLIALSNAPLTSSTTATLLTPSSFISFIASRVVASAVVEMTAEKRLRDGSARRFRGLEKNASKEGVFWAWVDSHERTLRSETMPRYDDDWSSLSISTTQTCQTWDWKGREDWTSVTSARKHAKQRDEVRVIGQRLEFILLRQVYRNSEMRVVVRTRDLLLTSSTGTCPAFAAAKILSAVGFSRNSSGDMVCLVAASVRKALTSAN